MSEKAYNCNIRELSVISFVKANGVFGTIPTSTDFTIPMLPESVQ